MRVHYAWYWPEAGVRSRLTMVLGLLTVTLMLRGSLMAETRSVVRAPEFPKGMQWLNTATPLRLADLRGKVVLLDFWTYCCINCMHVLPELRALESKYPNALVVIGVHCAKFQNERNAENIRQAIARYAIRHPVVNDHACRIWQAYAVRAWPTLIVVRPDGYVLDALSGEGHQQVLERMIDTLIAEARRQGTLDTTPVTLVREQDPMAGTGLAFPGKVYAHAPSNRLFIADSNHHRLVIANLAGTVLDLAGSGAVGRRDGPFATATFHQPQGMALDGDVLYVADTGNHLIRRLDLQTRTVTTAAGTGEQARRYNVSGRGALVALNSPWDVTIIDRQLFIAMAGSHQVWVMHLDTGQLEPYAGSGREECIDGPRLQAAMAQPSGLTTDGVRLYVADSETSAVREVTLGLAGTVRTLVGEGLFDFGDQDGTGIAQVRLQHPLGIAFDAGALYIADTYNHKIKCLLPSLQTVSTFHGSGQPGQADGQHASFYEPGGLSVAAGKLYVADTNNHVIRVADLASGEVSTLDLYGLSDPEDMVGPSPTEADAADIIRVPVQQVQADMAGRLLIDLTFPEGYHLNPLAPLRYQVRLQGTGIEIAESDRQGHVIAPAVPLTIPFRSAPGSHQSAVDLTITFAYCRADNTGVCALQSVRWLVPLHTVPDAPGAEPRVFYHAEAPVLNKAW